MACRLTVDHIRSIISGVGSALILSMGWSYDAGLKMIMM